MSLSVSLHEMKGRKDPMSLYILTWVCSKLQSLTWANSIDGGHSLVSVLAWPNSKSHNQALITLTT